MAEVYAAYFYIIPNDLSEIKRLYFVDRGVYSEDVDKALRFNNRREELEIIPELEEEVDSKIRLEELNEKSILF